MSVHIGWPDRFMRFLGTFIFIFITANLQVFIAKAFADFCFDGIHGSITQVHTISTHVSDLSAFVQSLCKQHGFAHAITKFSTGFLLKGRSGERCGWCAFGRTNLDVFYGIFSAFATFEESFRICNFTVFIAFRFKSNSSVIKISSR